MDAEEFRKRAKEMVDYVADYLENIRDRRPLPTVKPGYLRELIPDEAPRDPELWGDVFHDIERVIMPGVSMQGQLSNWESSLDTIAVFDSTLPHTSWTPPYFLLHTWCKV